MVEYEITVNRTQRTVYFPKVVVETLGKKLILVPNHSAAIIYPQGKDADVVLKSLRLLFAQLKLRGDMSGKKHDDVFTEKRG